MQCRRNRRRLLIWIVRSDNVFGMRALVRSYLCLLPVLMGCSTDEPPCGDYSRLHLPGSTWTYQSRAGAGSSVVEVLEEDNNVFSTRWSGTRGGLTIHEAIDYYQCDDEGVWHLGYRSDLSFEGLPDFDRQFRVTAFDPPFLVHPLPLKEGMHRSLSYEGYAETTFRKDGLVVGQQEEEFSDTYEVGVDPVQELTTAYGVILTTPVWTTTTKAPAPQYIWLAEGIGEVQSGREVLVDWE